MIAAHQPDNFLDDLVIGVSSVDDGNMKHSYDSQPLEVRQNRQRFLAKLGISLEQTSLVRLDYRSNDFCRYRLAGPAEQGVSMEHDHDTVPVDGLATDQIDHGLFLPVADCCPLILADRNGPAFMLSHMGRHSAEQDGASRSVSFLTDSYGLSPSDLKAWLGPTVGAASYPLHAFDGASLSDVVAEQLGRAGVTDIEVNTVDVADDERYFSHSQFKKGRRPHDGRFAVVAQRRQHDHI